MKGMVSGRMHRVQRLNLRDVIAQQRSSADALGSLGIKSSLRVRRSSIEIRACEPGMGSTTGSFTWRTSLHPSFSSGYDSELK